jgi:hypothetical protein
MGLKLVMKVFIPLGMKTFEQACPSNHVDFLAEEDLRGLFPSRQSGAHSNWRQWQAVCSDAVFNRLLADRKGHLPISPALHALTGPDATEITAQVECGRLAGAWTVVELAELR